MEGLPEAFAGQEIEDLQYGAGPLDSGEEDADQHELWWQESEEDDEDFIANLTGSDIDQLQSQSSVHASESDVSMSDSESTTDTDDAMDEFGFPLTFGMDDDPQPAEDQPLILMENWDGQFVLVQPKNERSRSRRDRGSRGAGSTTDSVAASLSASEQQLELVIDADAENETDTDSDWCDFDGDDDGGDTTDSMAEEDMPMLDGSGFDELIATQQFAANNNFGAVPPIPLPPLTPVDENGAPMIIVTDTALEAAAAALPLTPVTAAPVTPVPVIDASAPTSPANVMNPPLPVNGVAAPVTAPVMGTFHVSHDPCAHAVIDGSKTTTKSPFARRRRKTTGETSSQTSNKRRSSLNTASTDPFSPVLKKTRYSSIPGHPRYIAARRAAQALVDPLDRESTPSDDEPAFSLEDIMDASMLRVNDIDSGDDSTDKQEDAHHLFRFDKVPVSMYMRRNFNSSGSKRRHVEPDSMPMYAPARGGGRATLADTLAGPANRMLISPMLAPQQAAVYEEPTSRKERRRARKAAAMDIGPLHI